MILTIEDIKTHLPLNSINDISKYEAFEIRALYKYLPKYLGDILVESIYDFGTPLEDSANSELDPDAEDIDRLINALKPVLANLTILESIPQFNLVATGFGFGIVSNPNQAPASMDRVRDLKDSCLQAANDGLDRLLLFLENHADKYTAWNKSCINTGSLIPSAAVYDQFVDINCSRRRFVDLKRHINFEELTNFSNIFSAEFLTELRAATDTAVKPIIQQALAWSAEIQFQRSTNPTADVSYWRNKYVSALSNAMAYLRTHLDTYPVYASNAYEAPFNNATALDDDGEQYGFFIGGITG